MANACHALPLGWSFSRSILARWFKRDGVLVDRKTILAHPRTLIVLICFLGLSESVWAQGQRPEGVSNAMRSAAPSVPAHAADAVPQVPRGTILTAGDSLAEGYGMVLPTWLRGSGWTTINEGKVGSGLASPKLIDWEAKLPAMIAHYHPQVVILSLGTNDAGMPLHVDGRSYAYGTPDWQAAYARKISTIIQEAGAEGATVIFMPIPPLLNARWEGLVGPVRSVESAVVEPSGAMLAVTPNQVRSPALRARDGIHMTATGYLWMVDSALRTAWARSGYPGYAYDSGWTSAAR